MSVPSVQELLRKLRENQKLVEREIIERREAKLLSRIAFLESQLKKSSMSHAAIVKAYAIVPCEKEHPDDDDRENIFFVSKDFAETKKVFDSIITKDMPELLGSTKFRLQEFDSQELEKYYEYLKSALPVNVGLVYGVICPEGMINQSLGPPDALLDAL